MRRSSAEMGCTTTVGSATMGAMSPQVLLATFCLCPEGEFGGEAIDAALAARGISAAWARWDDPTVDWAAADLVAVRSTWDYHRRLTPFFAWARSVETHTTVLNGVDTFLWNHDKVYLPRLGESVPVVPCELVEDDDLFGGLERAVARFGTVVMKPRVGASGVGVVVVEGVQDHRLAWLTPGPWLAQPLVESVRTRGESSVVVLGGRAVTQVDKVPAPGEIRVHEQHGGRSDAVPLDDEAASLAVRAMAAAEALVGHGLDYGRVDLMELDGRLVVGELELIEPGLYLEIAPEAGAAFADVVAARLAG